MTLNQKPAKRVVSKLIVQVNGVPRLDRMEGQHST